LFGNHGPADWKKNNTNLIIMQSSIKKLNDETLLVHADIDSSRHAIELENKELKQVSTMVNINLIKLTNADEELVSLKIYFEIVTLAEAVEIQIDSLIDMKTDSMKGFCNEKAINKDFLIENLQNLEANRAGLGPVFGSWEWREYYKNPVCSVALEDDSVWVTVRIPIVRKSEKLIRSIPSPKMKEVLTKVESYGIRFELFKEKENDKFHLITESAFDHCNLMGNTRTCGVHDLKFAEVTNLVVPVEFAHNRVILVLAITTVVKFMEKCTNGIKEYMITTDAVILVPNNCSYVSSSISVDSREADLYITREIGMVHFERLEISKVTNLHTNLTLLQIRNVANETQNVGKLLQLHNGIEKQINSLDFKHENFWAVYKQDKWFFIGTIVGLIACVVMYKLISVILRKRKNNRMKKNVEEIELASMNSEKPKKQHQQSVCVHDHSGQNLVLDKSSDLIENVYAEVYVAGSSNNLFSYP